MKALVIAAPSSNSGKTTVALGLMECLRRRGLAVAPFKVGPDFIDPGYHRLVTGRPSVNLDPWICPPAFVRRTFAHHTAATDMAVVEGVMGLFDGLGASDQGSTAAVARLLGLPVLLVLDAKGLGRTAAALVRGLATFDRRVRVTGVIFNNVGSDSHARLLREAMAETCPAVRVIGCLPRDENLHIPSRHLGLLTIEEHPLSPEYFDHLVTILRDRIDFGLLWEAAATRPGDGPTERRQNPAGRPRKRRVPIAVARDAAFCFVYEDNLRLLREAGAELVEFSPLQDSELPSGIAGLYLPGGYPEAFADTLAANRAMKSAVRDAVARGLPVYAECGGFLYLTRGIYDTKREPAAFHEFAGVFPVVARMLPRRKALGYREVELVGDTLLGTAGTVLRGHEFHYSEVDEMPAEVERLYRLRRPGEEVGMEGYRIGNCLASYVHLHFGSCPEGAQAFIATCWKFARGSRK